MGRHSAPDEDGLDVAPADDPADGAADDAVTLTLAGAARPSTGRHAAVEIAKEERARLKAAVKKERAERTVAVKKERAEHKAAARRARRERKRARWERGSRADLRMLRHNPAVRLQCIGVLVIAFAGYTVAMLELGRGGRGYLYWIWIPIVVSGVLVGACLDLAHHRAAQRSAALERASGSVPESSDP